MDLSALGLAIIPPALAILVEALNPINERMIGRSVDLDLQGNEDLARSSFFVDTVDRVTKLSTAAVEIAGLAPTLVASVTSGFAVIHELPSPFWPAIIYALIFIGVALFVIWLLSGTTFYAAAVLPIEIRFSGSLSLTESQPRENGRTRQKVVATSIYAINGILIGASVVVFAVNNWLVTGSCLG
jgi:hypothetical protein